MNRSLVMLAVVEALVIALLVCLCLSGDKSARPPDRSEGALPLQEKRAIHIDRERSGALQVALQEDSDGAAGKGNAPGPAADYAIVHGRISSADGKQLERRWGGGGGRALRVRVKASATADSALQWLARQQQDDGSTGMLHETAEAILAFLAAGYTDRGSERDNPYAKCVRQGLRALMNSQDTDGRFGTDLRTHIRATAAMCEAYWMTRNPRYRKPAQNGLNYPARARAKEGAWSKDKLDTLTTVNAVLALKSGNYAGLAVDPDAFEGVRARLNKTGPNVTPEEAFAVLFALVLLGEEITRWPEAIATPKTLAGREWAALARFRITGQVVDTAEVAEAKKSDGSWGSIPDTAIAVRILTVSSRYERVLHRR